MSEDLDVPISTPAQDTLNRSGFARHLANAVFEYETGTSRGVAIGLIGEWGSGKTSILNLVQDHLEDTSGTPPVILRFDPWLFSSRDDLVTRFFSELQEAIYGRPDLSTRAATFLSRLKSYATDIATEGTAFAANFFIPGSGQFAGKTIRGIANAANSQDSPSAKTLHEKRADLEAALKDARLPIVVLIDDIDRVEDSEVGQLLNS